MGYSIRFKEIKIFCKEAEWDEKIKTDIIGDKTMMAINNIW